MSELAVYGLARDTAIEEAGKTDQTGTKVFGFEDSYEGYEVTTAAPEELVEYNLDLAIAAPDTAFNLIVRKDNAKAIHKMKPDKLRDYLRQILENV